jgi:ribosomal protein S18 acetylase RimI-like enzyme
LTTASASGATAAWRSCAAWRSTSRAWYSTGVICATAQLIRPPRNNEAQAHTAQLTTNFVAPWARGHGLARGIVLAVEEEARVQGVSVLNLDVRETQEAAIQLYQSLGYSHYGTHPRYARVDGQWVAGLFFWKDLA